MTHRQYQCTTLIHTNLTFWYERNFREMKLKIKTVITSVTLSILVARTQWKSLSHPFRLYVIHLNVLMKREIGMNERERASASTNTNATIRHSYGNGIRAKANVEPRFIVIDAVNRMAYFCCLFSCSCSHSYSPERVYECLLVGVFVCRLCCYRRKHKPELLFCSGVSFMLQRHVLLRYSWSPGISIPFSSAISCLCFLHKLCIYLLVCTDLYVCMSANV